jgi:hypothetical protein
MSWRCSSSSRRCLFSCVAEQRAHHLWKAYSASTLTSYLTLITWTSYQDPAGDERGDARPKYLRRNNRRGGRLLKRPSANCLMIPSGCSRPRKMLSGVGCVVACPTTLLSLTNIPSRPTTILLSLPFPNFLKRSWPPCRDGGRPRSVPVGPGCAGPADVQEAPSGRAVPWLAGVARAGCCGEGAGSRHTGGKRGGRCLLCKRCTQKVPGLHIMHADPA